jgi:hypothetical protein
MMVVLESRTGSGHQKPAMNEEILSVKKGLVVIQVLVHHQTMTGMGRREVHFNKGWKQTSSK